MRKLLFAIAIVVTPVTAMAASFTGSVENTSANCCVTAAAGEGGVEIGGLGPATAGVQSSGKAFGGFTSAGENSVVHMNSVASGMSSGFAGFHGFNDVQALAIGN
jgi:hypothetical protein